MKTRKPVPVAKKSARAKIKVVARPPASVKTKAVPSSARGARARKVVRARQNEYLLRLYVAGQTPRSLQAFANLKQICEEYLAGRYQLEIVDLLLNPGLARGDQILALPALVRQLPPPVKKIIGDFTDAERVLVGLDLRELKAKGRAR